MKKKKVKEPLYTPQDVESFLSLKTNYAKYEKPIKIYKDITVTFYNAGHILGSAFVEIKFIENGLQKTIVFSGDLGNNNDLILPPLTKPKEADALYIESTYGDRDRKNMADSITELKEIVKKTLSNEGKYTDSLICG